MYRSLFVLFVSISLVACGGSVTRDGNDRPNVADLNENGTGGSSTDFVPETVGEAGSSSVDVIDVDEEPAGDAGSPSIHSEQTGGTPSTGGSPTIATGGSISGTPTSTGGSITVPVDNQAGTSEAENGGSVGVIDLGTGGTLDIEPIPAGAGGEVAVENGGEDGSINIGNQAGAGHAATGGSAGSESCVPNVIVRSVAHTGMVISAGSQDVVIATFEIETDCDIEVSSIDMVLSTPDAENAEAWPYCDAPCSEASDWYFSDLKLVEASNAVLMGPIGFSDYTSNDHAHARLANSLMLHAGEPRAFYATMDVRADLPSEVIGLRYGLLLSDVAMSPSGAWTHENSSFGTYFTLGEEAGEEEPCGPFMIRDTEHGAEFEVGSYLEFSLSPDSPSGAMESGLQTVLVVNATAHCGDIALEHVLFQTVSDWGGGMEWMWHLQNVVTGVSYLDGGTMTFRGYGPDHAELPYSSVTGMYWDHAFTESIVIPEGETFTLSLSVTLDDSVLPEGEFRFDLYPRTTWYGVDDPEAYPIDIQGQRVSGHNLSFDGGSTITAP